MDKDLHAAFFARCFTLCCACLLIVVTAVDAQTIAPGLSTRRTITNDLFGFNTGTTIRGGSSCVNPNLLAKMPLLKPQVYRFPQGAFSSWYNWREGWVYDDPNVPDKYASLTKVPNKLEDYKVLRDASGVQATILGVNMILSDIPEQIAMLKHADSIGIPVKYVELGNEFYLEGDDPDSAYILQKFPTPADYGIAATIWADSIHKYFPNAKVAAQGVFDKNSAPRRKIWNDSVLAHLEGEDAMTFHFYYPSADADSLETTAEKLDVTMQDVPDWLYQPYKGWDILQNKSMVKVRPGKEVWITEFNLSDHERPTHGYWTHGLYQALQTLLLLQDDRITKVTPHGMCGTAVYGSHFYDTEGFVFGNGDDPSFIPPPVQPATTFWGLTACGNNMTMVGNAMYDKGYASPIQFTPNPQVVAIEKGDSIYYNGLFGYLFNNGTASDALILNLTGSVQQLTTNIMFPAGGTFEMRYAPALQLIATAADVTVVNGTLPATLMLQPYSSTRITSSSVPYAPPSVAITVNGPTTFCAGDSVELDAGAGHITYNWSNGKTTRKIWVKATGDYSVKAYDYPAGYYGEASVHITVNPVPTKPNIKVTDPKTFCEGGSALLYLGPNFTYTNVTYLWPLTGENTPQATITTTGNHYLLITDNATGCYVASDTETITVNPLPQPVISPVSAAQGCYDVGVTLQVNQVYNNYNWSDGGNLQTDKFFTSGTYWVNVKDANGCQANSNAIEVTVWEPDYPTITPMGPATFCLENPTTLATIPGYACQWTKGGAVITGATAQIYIPTASGLYKVTVTDAHGCSKKNDAGINITVNSLSAPAISVSNGSILCQNETTNLSMPEGYYNYSWSTGATGNMITVGSSGAYTCMITDLNGCVSTSPVKVITVNPLPQPIITATGPTSFCYDQSVTLSAQAGFNQYTWSNGKSGQSITAETNGPITVTVKDANNCYGTSPSLNLTVWDLPVPTVTITGPVAYCIENPSTLSTIPGYTYQWKKGATVLVNATNQTYQPTVTNALYKVVITDIHGCSRTSDNFSVTVNSGTPASLTVTGGTTICQGQSTNIAATAGYVSYMWSSGQTSSSITVTNAGNYAVTTTDVNGCIATSSPKTIVVNALPQPSITALGATSFCDGGSVMLDAGTGYNSYSWSNGKSTQTVSITASGNYTVTVTDANGCSATSPLVTVTEWIPPTPVISTSTGATVFCANAGVYLTTIAGYSYQWQKAGVDIAGATQQNYLPVSGGNYKVVITDAHGCQKTSSSFTITINNNPAPVITGPSTVCQGSSIVLSCGTFSNYNWSTGSTSPTITVNAAGSFTVTVTDANGCSGTSAAKNITISSSLTPVITAQGPTQFCDGGSVVLDAGSGFSSYAWSNGKTTQTTTITASGSFAVTVTNSSGCSGTSSFVNVDEWIPPTPVITTSSGTITYCTGSGYYLTTISGYAYQWQKSSVNISGATGQNFTPTSGGTYKVIITDSHGCSKTSSGLAVTQFTSPSPVITGPSAVCVGSSITLSCGSFVSYAWSNGSQAASINIGTAGSYAVTVTDANGCSGTSAPKTVTASQVPVPAINALSATQFCDGGNVTLDAGSGYSSYSWSNSKTTQTISVTATGNYTVTVTNSAGCSGTSSPVTVTVWTLPAVNVSAVGPTTYCLNAGTYLTTVTGPYNYQWLKGTTAQNGATNQNFTPVSSGTYKVQVTDQHGCNKTSSGLKVTVNPLPAATISVSGSTNICSGQTKTIAANTGSGLTYAWKKDGASIAGATASTYVAATAGNYACVVTNASGCSSTSNSLSITSNCKDGMLPADDNTSWLIYPNPTTGDVHIRVNTGADENGSFLLEIRSLAGAVIRSRQSTFTDHLILADLFLDAEIAAGMYVVVLHVGENIYHQPLIVTRE